MKTTNDRNKAPLVSEVMHNITQKLTQGPKLFCYFQKSQVNGLEGSKTKVALSMCF